jgi:hypothetical protein
MDWAHVALSKSSQMVELPYDYRPRGKMPSMSSLIASERTFDEHKDIFTTHVFPEVRETKRRGGGLIQMRRQ